MTVRDDITVLSDNLRILSERMSGSERQRDICLSELIDRLISDGADRTPEDLYREFSLLCPSISHTDSAGFLRTLAERLPRTVAAACSFAEGEETPPGAHGRIAMVRNRYNEEALEHFSHVIIGAKHLYEPSFAQACEDVLNGKCEYAILPLENTSDGRLMGFYAMLDRYELRICAACELETEDRLGRVRYGLIGKKLPDRLPKDLSWNLEFSVAEENDRFPTDIAEASAILNATLLRIDSMPVSYDDGMQRFYYTFSVPESYASAFDVYLNILHTHYTPIGLYPILYRQ